ncbi:MAG: hypothetical protein ACKERG_04395 [Candidatus Hodgkinia cicadicola]
MRRLSRRLTSNASVNYRGGVWGWRTREWGSEAARVNRREGGGASHSPSSRSYKPHLHKTSWK